MEEADARLQEVLASLLNEHEGNHEPALRQTFACLHNSGLYEAQSAAEEEQREQQVLAVFRSFPFRAPAAPIDDGVDSLVEETQAPPPAYSSLVREPEEAGEVTPAQPDPENVGEDAAGAQSAPEALLPLNPRELQDEERTCATRPEVSHQGAALSGHLAPVIETAATAAEVGFSQEDAAVPEGLSSGFGGGTTAVAEAGATGAVGTESLPPRCGGVEEEKGGVWGESTGASVSGIGFPERAEEGTAAADKVVGSSGFRASASADQRATRVVGVGENMSVGKGMVHGADGRMGEEFAANGDATVSSKDPESTRQNREDLEDRYKVPHLHAEPPQYEEEQQTLLLNGGGDGGRGANGHNLSSAAGASALGVTSGASAAATAAPALPKRTAVTDPHLKTAGQPLRHTDTVKSPTGVSTDLQNKLRALKIRRKHRFLVMRIEGTEVVAETAGAPSQGPEELRAALPFSDCRYAVYDQEVVTSDGRKTSKLFFFSWLPHNATPQTKMVYLYGKVTVKQRLEGVYDVAANMFEDIETALGLEQDDEDSEIDFES